MANGKKKKSRVPGMLSRPKAQVSDGGMAQLEASALHESAHTVVAHAVGRRPVYAGVLVRILPVGHPENHIHVPILSTGYSKQEPFLAAEVNAIAESGAPVPQELRTWLLQEIVISQAGPYIEEAATFTTDGGLGDRQQIAQAAMNLGAVVAMGDDLIVDPRLVEEASDLVYRILKERLDDFVAVTNALGRNGELHADELAQLMSMPLGSHTHLLDRLEQLTSGN
jgi:hypothetical protein